MNISIRKEEKQNNIINEVKIYKHTQAYAPISAEKRET